MLNIYSTASSIERDWKNKNVEINKIFDDISGVISMNDFIELYEHATEEKNDCLTIINNSMDKRGIRFYKNYNIELFVK
jgi:hypothetical protein